MQIYHERSWSDYPVLGAEIASVRKKFYDTALLIPKL